MDEVRIEVEELRHYKWAFSEQRVRDHKHGCLVNHTITEQENIDVDLARPPPRPGRAPEVALQPFQDAEKLPGRHRRVQLGDGVEERRLPFDAPRRGLDHLRSADELDPGVIAEPVQRPLDRRPPVAQVGAEADEDPSAAGLRTHR